MTGQGETERASPTDPRSQGDIIRIDHATDVGDPTLGVVINADCDLAHGRLDGVITYLPIYSFHDYVAHFWASMHVEEVATAATKKLLEIVGQETGDEASLVDWIRSEGATTVSTALQRLDLRKGQAGQIDREARRLEIALDDQSSAFERFSRLCRKEPDPSAYARKQVAAAKKAMGEGHFFISELVEHDALGYVIRMRRVFTIPEDRYFRSIAEQRSRSGATETTAVRVGRLTELYRFKVLQLFAHQFSRIGLPDDVTALSGLAVEDLVATLV